MTGKNALVLIKDAALGPVKDPIGTTGRAVGQVVGLTRSTMAIGATVVGGVVSRLPLPDLLGSEPRPKVEAAEPASEPATRSATGPEAQPAEASRKAHGDPVAPDRAPRTTASAKKAPARKAPARSSTAKKAPVTSIDAAADAEHVDATPADVARAVTSKPARRTTTRSERTTTADRTASEPLVDPATTKAVASEASVGARGASTDPS
jgi:hypothetical protein